jgi:hypothetical protein
VFHFDPIRTPDVNFTYKMGDLNWTYDMLLTIMPHHVKSFLVYHCSAPEYRMEREGYIFPLDSDRPIQYSPGTLRLWKEGWISKCLAEELQSRQWDLPLTPLLYSSREGTCLSHLLPPQQVLDPDDAHDSANVHCCTRGDPPYQSEAQPLRAA